ncbi:hypothetical protein B0T10DRAFT_196828 [Thelonectria olida]|uniref:Uncharacterized protein n=1 Tax=Thelonectria olida TaxID=1576542 RepID=A0A9P8VU19_9HYPO|nr:hypothetical protein B0T10DRAFT_196828 [Thelonectria olida]
MQCIRHSFDISRNAIRSISVREETLSIAPERTENPGVYEDEGDKLTFDGLKPPRIISIRLHLLSNFPWTRTRYNLRAPKNQPVMNAEFGMINENGEDERDRKVVDSNKTQPADEARSVHDASPPPKRIADLKSEVERLENDDTASEMDLTRARLEYGIELAGYPQFGDAETPLSSVRWNLVETQACVKTLVEVLRTNNKFPEAQRLYDRALRGVCRSRGRHHPWTLELQNNLACLHAAVGEVEVAEKLFKKSSKGKGIVFGNEHLTTLKTQWNLTLVSFRRHQEKSSQFSDQLDLPSLVRIYRGEDADFQSLAKQLCYVYSQTGRQGRAAKLCEEFTVDLVPQAEDPCHFYEDNLIPSVDTEHRSPVASSEQPDALTALREGLDWLGPRGASYLVGAFARTRKAIVKRAESSTPTLVVERLSKWVGKITSPSIGPANLWGFLAYLEDPKILLEQAAGTGQEDLVKLLLTAWPKPNISNDAEMSALLGALKKGIESRNVLVLQQFLEHGNYANSRGESKQIPLHIAAEVGCEDAFRTLLMAGSEASTRDARGDTPLDLALRRNHESIIRVMMVERHALISSSNGSVLPAHDGEKVEYTEADYTGLDATIVDFYTDLPHKAEEHRVRKEQLEKIISNPEILSQILCNDEDQDGYAPANFTWIHMPANNVYFRY